MFYGFHGDSGSQGLLERLDPHRQVVPGVIEVLQLRGNGPELLVELLDPFRLAVYLRFAEDRFVFLLFRLEEGDPLFGLRELLFQGRGRARDPVTLLGLLPLFLLGLPAPLLRFPVCLRLRFTPLSLRRSRGRLYPSGETAVRAEGPGRQIVPHDAFR